MNIKGSDLDVMVEKIVKENIKPVVSLTVREIAGEVKKITGFTPSTSVIAASLERLNRHSKWAWRHKQNG